MTLYNLISITSYRFNNRGYIHQKNYRISMFWDCYSKLKQIFYLLEIFIRQISNDKKKGYNYFSFKRNSNWGGGHTLSMWKFLGQRLNPNRNCNLCHRLHNSRSFNILCQARDLNRCSWILNPLRHSRNCKKMPFFQAFI